MIVKVQRALYDSEGLKVVWNPERREYVKAESVLVYDEKRDLYAELHIASEDAVKLLGDDMKGYFQAERGRKGKLNIGERVADQPW